jgi:hypothetical protein
MSGYLFRICICIILLVEGSCEVRLRHDFGKYIVCPRIVDGVYLATVYQLHMFPMKVSRDVNVGVTSIIQFVCDLISVGHNDDDPKVANFLVP